MSSCCAFCKKRYLYVRLPLYRARCAPRFRRREALRARGPRRCFRTPSPSQDRGGGLPLVLRGRPAPARPPRPPARVAAQRPEGQRLLVTVLRPQFGDLLQGNRRCSCPGRERGAGVPEGEAGAEPGRLPRAPSPRRTPRPTPAPVGFLIAQGWAGRGVAGTGSTWQGLPYVQLRPSLPPGPGGGRGGRREHG